METYGNDPNRLEREGRINEAVRGVAEAIHLYHEAFVQLRKAERSVNGLQALAANYGSGGSKGHYRLPLAVYAEPSVLLNSYLRGANKNVRALTGERPFYKFMFKETLGEMSLHGSGHRLTDEHFIADEIKADTGGFVKVKNSEIRSVLILPPRINFNLELAKESDF